MDKTSTQLTHSNDQMRQNNQSTPAKKTLDFIRQFARVYMSTGNNQGLVLN